MTHIWMMRAMAVMWLRYERGCGLVMLERGPGLNGVPDALGVLAERKRRLVEIEIKRSMADFRREKKKWRSRQRLLNVGRAYPVRYDAPLQFYFLIEAGMVEKCKAELPDWAGLMSAPAPDEPRRQYCGIAYPIVRVPAPMNKLATSLTPRQWVAMAKHQTGTVSSLLNALANSKL